MAGFLVDASASGHRATLPSTMPALDEEEPAVRGGRVADLVDRFDRIVDRGIEPNREISAEDIVVDGARHADHGQAVLGFEELRAAERAVAADHHQAFDAVSFECARGFRAAGRLLELFRAIGF